MKLNLLKLLIFYALGIYYGIIACCLIIFRIIRRGGVQWLKVKTRDVPPKCISQPDIGVHNYIQLDNIKIHYVEAGDKTKPLILFLHGYPDFWFTWRYQLEEFCKDYWCIAIDMRGYGDSDKPKQLSAYRMTNLIEDVRQIVQTLGREKFILIGNDWGGAIAWAFTEIFPNMIIKYVIINGPHTKVFQKLYSTNSKQRKMSWYVNFYQLPYLPELLMRSKDLAIFDNIFPAGTPNDILEAYKYTFGKPNAFTGPINYYRNIPFNKPFKMQTNSDQSPHGLYLVGVNDPYMLPDFAELTLDIKINLQVEKLNLNHFAHIEDPKLINQLIRDFLSK